MPDLTLQSALEQADADIKRINAAQVFEPDDEDDDEDEEPTV